MPHKFCVATQVKEAGFKEELVGEFSDPDWDLLQRYFACSWRLPSAVWPELSTTFTPDSKANSENR
jgi:hypothetical protein